MKPRSLRWFALASVALLWFGCADEASRIQEHLEKGEAYLEEEEFPSAVIEYKGALQLDPNLADAHYGLAKAYLRQNKAREGYWELSETVRLAPDNVEARMQFGQLSKLAGDSEQALTQADAVLAIEADNVNAHLLRGQSLASLGRNDEAVEALRAAHDADPEQSAAILLLGNHYRVQGDRESAEPLFRKLTEVDGSFTAWVAWGGFLSEDPAREADAEAAYRKGVEIADEDQKSVAYRSLASFYHRRERVGDAEQVLKDAIEARPDDLDLIYLLARMYRGQGRKAEADEMIESATLARPDDVQPFLILSLYRGRQGDRDGALAAAEDALQVDPTHVGARLRKAELLIDKGHAEKRRDVVAQGRAVVDAVLAEDSASAEALFVRAKVFLADGDPKSATADLRRVLDLRENWAQAYLLLGSALFLDGDELAARAALQRALEIDAALIDARRILARVHAALGDNEAAVAEGRAVLNQRTEDDEQRILVAQSLVRQRRFDEGLAELQRIPNERRSAEAYYALGRIYRLQGKTQLARQSFEQALDSRPAQPDILRALLELDHRQDTVKSSAARIEAALETDPDNPHLVHLSGLAWLLQGEGARAESQLRRAINLDPNELRFYESLARYFQVSGRTSDMLETYEKALSARPDSAPLNLIVGTLHELQGNPEAAEVSYEAAIRLDPELAPAKNNLAYLLAESGKNLDRALDLAQEAKAMLPDNPNTADTLGWVLYKKGINSAAIEYLREADEGFDVRNPNFGIVRHHLALAYEANGEPAKARSTLERALEDLAAQLPDGAREPGWAADVRAMLERLPQG